MKRHGKHSPLPGRVYMTSFRVIEDRTQSLALPYQLWVKVDEGLWRSIEDFATLEEAREAIKANKEKNFSPTIVWQEEYDQNLASIG